MLAYPNGDKQTYLARVRAHRAADELIRGTGWEDGRGCAVGCTLNAYNHALYPALLGVPVQLAHLQDWLFENLPENHLEWPERFLSAIEPGADLTGVWPTWVVRLLGRRLAALAALGGGGEPWRQCRESIARVRDLYGRRDWDDLAAADAAAWAAARAAARAAAQAAAQADAAADAAAWAAARAATRAAAQAAAQADAAAAAAAWAATEAAEPIAKSAARAAWAAARAAARAADTDAADAAAVDAAWADEVRRQASDLIELLAAAPVAGGVS